MTATKKIVGSGKFTYEMVEDWAKVPKAWLETSEGFGKGAAAVGGDSQDRIYSFNRDPEHPIVIFDREGNYLSSWGAGLFVFPHAIWLDKEDNVWVVDAHGGQVMKFTSDGQLLMTIGTKGFRSDTGVDPTDYNRYTYARVTQSGPPFNIPTDVDFNEAGEIFVSDGYANARVHRFSPEGKLLDSWGQPGEGPCQFNTPHGISIDRKGRVLVADRENFRVQVLTQEGEHLTTWSTELYAPAMFYIDDEDIVYVPELNAGLMSILTLEGERLARWGSINHLGVHGIWVDSHKDMYVVESVVRRGLRRIVKFIRQ